MRIYREKVKYWQNDFAKLQIRLRSRNLDLLAFMKSQLIIELTVKSGRPNGWLSMRSILAWTTSASRSGRPSTSAGMQAVNTFRERRNSRNKQLSLESWLRSGQRWRSGLKRRWNKCKKPKMKVKRLIRKLRNTKVRTKRPDGAPRRVVAALSLQWGEGTRVSRLQRANSKTD